MIRNIKGNNLLKKYQTGATITTPKVSPKAISFTSGFETDRGYPNNGYTSSTEPRNMSDDYGYILEDLPEPLQVILLDAVHNQSNLPGTILLSLAENNPELYNTFIQDNAPGGMQSITPMKYAILIGNSIGSVKAYEAKDNPLSYWINAIKPMLLEAYNNDPSKFIDDFTLSRIKRNTSFPTKNTPVKQGSNSKMEEWAERSYAAAEYANDLLVGDAQPTDYYYDANKNENIFKEKGKSIAKYTEINKFSETPAWYAAIEDLHNDNQVLYGSPNSTQEEKDPPNILKDLPTTDQVIETSGENQLSNMLGWNNTTNIPKNPNQVQTYKKDPLQTIEGGAAEDVRKWSNLELEQMKKEKIREKQERLIKRGYTEEQALDIAKDYSNSGYELDKDLTDAQILAQYKYTPNLESITKEPVVETPIVDPEGDVDYINKVEPVLKEPKTDEEIEIDDRDKRNVIVDTPSINTSFSDKQKIYTTNTSDKHYIFEGNTMWQVEMNPQSLQYRKKIEGTDRVLSSSEKEKTIDSLWELYGSDEEPSDQNLVKQPNVLKTVGNVLNKGVEKIDKLLRDKNPYRDESYGPIKDKNKELREERKAERQKNQAVRKTRIENIKQDNILKKINEKKDKREIINARREKAERKSKDKLETAKNIGDEKTQIKTANIRKRDKTQSERREGREERAVEIAELNKKIAQAEELLKPEEIENKQKIKTIKKRNILAKKENKKTQQITNRLKKLKENKIKLEQEEIDVIPLFGDMDRLEEALEEKRYGGKLRAYKKGGNLIKYQDGYVFPQTLIVGSKEWMEKRKAEKTLPAAGRWPGQGDWNNDGTITDKWGVAVIPKTKPKKAEELEEAINYAKEYDPYSLMRPSHKMSDAANWGVTGYNLALASQAPEKTPIFMTDYTPKRQYAPVDFTQAIKQQRIGRRGIAENTRDTAGLMGNLQQLNANILDRKVAIAKSAADKQLGFDRTYETAKELRAKELKDQRINQYYKNLEHEATKQNALTEAISKWNKQQQTKAKYIQAENKDMNKITGYVNELSPDYKVVVDKNGMVKVIHAIDRKEAVKKTEEMRTTIREQIASNEARIKGLDKDIDKEEIRKIHETIRTLQVNLTGVKDYSGPPSELFTTTIKKKGGNIKSRKTTNILMDGGYTPKTKRQKKLRTKLY